MMIEEARDPKTSLARLTEILDVCDQPRRNYAAAVKKISDHTLIVTGSLWRSDFEDEFQTCVSEGRAVLIPTLEPLVVATAQLDACLSKREFDVLAAAVASNPNLDREQWLRALEIAPRAAVSNPVLKLLLVERTPIIQRDHEVIALGTLALHASGTRTNSSERDALVDIICAGLPEAPEPFGGVFSHLICSKDGRLMTNLSSEQDASIRAAVKAAGVVGHELSHASKRGRIVAAEPANRYCWDGDKVWALRALAVHRAGRAVMDTLGDRSRGRQRTAFDLCVTFGQRLTRPHSRRAESPGRIPFAPRGHKKFTYELKTLSDHADNGCDHRVIGWSGPNGTVWKSMDDRPGFHAGRVRRRSEKIPEEIRRYVQRGWQADEWDDLVESYMTVELRRFSRVGSDPQSRTGPYRRPFKGKKGYAVVLVSDGRFACDGLAEVDGCSCDRPFPKAEIERLTGLFGRKSEVVRFARDPGLATCPDCGEWSLAYFGSHGEECIECYERARELAYGESDECDDVEDE